MQQRGFTLVEVLVAVAVLAIAMAAVISAMARQADNAGYLRQKTIALWVAHNRLGEIQLEQDQPSTGRTEGKAEMSGVEWKWQAEVKATPDERLHRVDLTVTGPAQKNQKSGSLAQLTGFLAVDP
ncbi:MAG: type II secretion system minor pseudopilin GspI [Panacagrimonas sp.]